MTFLAAPKSTRVANFLFDFLFKGAVIAAFIDAAGKQDHRPGKARQRFHDRADISSLRVVIIVYAVVFAYELEPVLETGKIIQGLLNPRARHPGAFRRGDGRHHVFDIVHAVNFHGAEHEAFFNAAIAPNDFVGRGKNALRHFGETEGDDPSLNPFAHVPTPADRHG